MDDIRGPSVKGKEAALDTFQRGQSRAGSDESPVEGIAAQREQEDENRQRPAVRGRVTLLSHLPPIRSRPIILGPETPRELGCRNRADPRQ